MSWEVFIEEPGPDFAWSVEGLAFPINLNNASFRVTNQNTETNRVTLKNDVPYYGTRELTLSGQSVNGVWTAFHGNDFINGTWPVIRNEGTVQAGKKQVLSLVEWVGVKGANPAIPQQGNGGPDTFGIPLSFSGFEKGKVKFTIKVNGTNVLTDTVTVGTPAPAKGYLSVQSRPSGAQVYIDGVFYGTTPLSNFQVPAGLRTVTVTKEGYRDYVTQVRVTSTGLRVITATLQPLFATIEVRSFPQGARVFLDGQERGNTPLRLTGVTPGTHTLLLTKPGYRDYSTSISIDEPKTIRLPTVLLQKVMSGPTPRSPGMTMTKSPAIPNTPTMNTSMIPSQNPVRQGYTVRLPLGGY